MTTYLINFADDAANANTPAFTLGSNDNILVTAAGELVATGSNSDGLDIDGVINMATLQGLVYGTVCGIFASSSTSATLFVNNDVIGEGTGIILTGSSATDNLTIAAGGVVQGGSEDGIDSISGATNITDYGAISGVAAGIIANGVGGANITVGASGTVSGSSDAVVLGSGLSAANLTVDGTASSSTGSAVSVQASYAEVTINGRAEGDVTGVDSSGSNNTITVDGSAQGENDSGVSIEGSDTALVVNGQVQAGEADSSAINVLNRNTTIAGENIYIGATGAVTGSYGISIEANDSTITNDGHISGSGVAIETGSSANLAITNNGTISEFSESGQGDAIYLASDTGAVIHNAGLITSTGFAIQIAGDTTAAIENTGAVQGALQAEGTGAVDVENAGLWESTAGLSIDESGNSTLTNSGKVLGPITMGAGTDTLTNTGKITGNVTFTGTGDSLTNGGEIHGLITMGTNDAFINTGSIHGNVILGTGDTLDTSEGIVTGKVTAATSDTFDFSGLFGHEEIRDFTGYPSHNTSFDVINFASDDFTSYTELQSHMAQVGKDVVITLDAADDIILVDTKLSHLDAHDFTFGT